MPPFLQAGQAVVPFAGGIETKLDAKQVPPARLLDLQNGVFTKGTTISKRNGYRALSRAIEAGGAEYENPRGTAVRDDEQLVFADGPDGHPHAYSHRPSSDRWSDAGRVESVVVTEHALVKTGTEQVQVDASTAGGVTVVAWADSRGGVWWASVEEATGRVLTEPAQLLATGIYPRVVAVGSRLHIYVADLDAKRIYIGVVDSAAPTQLALFDVLTGDLGSVGAAGPWYDACPVDETAALIAWTQDVGGYRVGYVDVTGVLGSALTGHPGVHTESAALDGRLSVAFGLAGIAVTWAEDDEAHIDWYATSLGGPISTTTRPAFAVPIDGISSVIVGGTLWVAFEQAAAEERDYALTMESYAIGAGSATTSVTVRGLGLATRAWAVGSRALVYAVHDAPFFSVYVALSMLDGTCVARSMPTVAHGRALDGWTSSVTMDPDDDTAWRAPLLYNEQLESVVGEFAETGVRWVVLDFESPEAWQTAQLGKGLYLAGACPQHYDGARWAEAGFHYAPDGEIDATDGAGGEMEAGVYTYRITYEEVDSLGEVHRGPTSVGTEAEVSATTGDQQVTLTIPTYRCTSRPRVRIAVWRSEANTTEAFHRVTSLDPSATGDNGYLLNNPDVDTVTFIDGMSDADLIEQEELYTNGGVLSNDPAAMDGAAIAVGKGRLFFTDPSDPHLVRYTQELADGFAAEFAAPLALRVDPYGGAIVGLHVQDDVVLVFKESAIYAFGGPGPLAAPSIDPSLAFTPAALITGDVGLEDPRSIAYTPVGSVFKSNKGIQLLDRSRQLIDLGGPVEAFDAFAVRRATLLPDQSRVLFLTDDADGRALLYDYEHKQWSTFTNHLGVDACIVGGVYRYLRTDGRVFVEEPGTFDDDGSHIRLLLVTAWIKLVPYLQGWHRFWDANFIGEYKSEHTLRVRYALDYEPGWSAPFDLDVDANFTPTPYGEGDYGDGPYGGGEGSSRYQRKLNLGKRGQAIRFRIEDVEATNTFGAAFELSELLLTGGLVRGAVKLEAARSD